HILPLSKCFRQIRKINFDLIILLLKNCRITNNFHFDSSLFLFETTNILPRTKESVTEVIYDFVFTPPRAQIGFQSSVIPDTGTHLRTALFVFELGKSTYVTIPL